MEIINKLADAQHKIWNHWMKYMFTQGAYDLDGNWIMPKEKVERWQRQMNIEYKFLSEKEQKSDKEIVKKYIINLLK